MGLKIIQKANKVDLDSIDIAKVHGRTKIELYNPSTKIKQIYRDENVFQSSNIAKWFATLGDNNIRPMSSDTFVNAPWKSMVGGLLLFRDAITEGDQFMSAGNVMVGKACADVTNMDTPIELGSFNTIESFASASAITQVYDFTTSQANGTIGCVCLTSKEGGLVGYGNTSGQRYTGTKYSLGLYGKVIDFVADSNYRGTLAENGKRYFIQGNSTDSTIDIYEQSAIGLQNHASIFAGLRNVYSFDWSNYNSKFRQENCFYWYYVGNNKFRIINESYGTVAAGDACYYLEFDCTTHNLTEKSFTNSSGVTIDISSYYYSSKKPFFTRDGKIMVVKSGSPSYPILIDLTTSIVVWTGEQSGTPYVNQGCITIGNGLYIYGTYIIDTVRNTVLPIDSNGSVTVGGGAYSNNVQASDFVGGYYQTGGGNQNHFKGELVAYPFYLATINNLQTAVTKTAAQTMKVTYTLTEV